MNDAFAHAEHRWHQVLGSGEWQRGSRDVHREPYRALDVILMDVQMPVMDGLEGSKMIRKYEEAHKEAGTRPDYWHHCTCINHGPKYVH